jgi:hypothetical protein
MQFTARHISTSQYYLFSEKREKTSPSFVTYYITSGSYKVLKPKIRSYNNRKLGNFRHFILPLNTYTHIRGDVNYMT